MPNLGCREDELPVKERDTIPPPQAVPLPLGKGGKYVTEELGESEETIPPSCVTEKSGKCK